MADYPVGVSVEEGLELLLENCTLTEIEEVELSAAMGRILAENQISKENIPPFNRSPLDGYAVRACDIKEASADVPVELTIIEEVPAGYFPSKTVGKWEAVKILTGAPIPNGADVVIKFEETRFNEEKVEIMTPYPSGRNIVYKGEDVSVGDVVVSVGTKISAATVGLLAGLGIVKIPVFKRPTVAIISTGDELVEIATKELPSGKIRNSSMYALSAFLNQYGVDTVLCGIASDDIEEIAKAIDEASKKADVVITTGGVSVGDYDMLGRAIEYLEAKVLFWKLQMKPGMAYLASVYQNKLILSLSGNPGSAAVSMLFTALPVLKKMAGYKDYAFKKTMLYLKEGFKKKSPSRRFLPGHLEYEDGKVLLSISDKQGNGMLHPLSNCEAIAVLKAGTGPVKPGEYVEAYIL